VNYTSEPNLVISFDMDEVLVPSPIGSHVFPVLAADLASAINRGRVDGSPITAEDLRNRAFAEWRRRVRDGDDMVAAYDWDDIFTSVVRQLGMSRQVHLAPYVEAFCRRPNDIPRYPEVEEQLAALRELGVRLLVVTNGHARYQLPILRALNLDQYFDRIATPDRAGYGKPDPRVFEWLFEGLAGRRNVHVGDRLRHDVYGPHQAGLEAVWLRRHMPGELSALAPSDRLASPLAQDFLRQQLKEEGIGAVDLTPYWPEYLARDLSELPELLGLEVPTNSRSGL
jgi:putative hydrolase of the HAD superfamily